MDFLQNTEGLQRGGTSRIYEENTRHFLRIYCIFKMRSHHVTHALCKGNLGYLLAGDQEFLFFFLS